MKVVLIWPPTVDIKTNFAGMASMPLGISYLAAYLREKGVSVKLIDAFGIAPENVKPFKEDYVTIGLAPKEIAGMVDSDANLAAISATASVSHNVVMEIINEIRKIRQDMKIVVGGNHASFEYKEFLKNGADFVILGEGEVALFELTQYLEGKKKIKDIDGIAWKDRKKIFANPKTRFVEDLDSLPFPARDLLPMETYWSRKEAHGPMRSKYTPIFSSRGCPFACSYCSSPIFWQRKWRPRSPKNVADEIEYCVKNFGITDFHFEDDNLTLKKDRIIGICKEIIERNLKITWNTPNGIRGDTVDFEVLHWMKKAGCAHITIAPETGSEHVLKLMNKNVNLEHQIEIVKIANRLGMNTCAFFIIGFPGENAEDRKKTKKYLGRLAAAGLAEVGIFIFTPLPGTKIFGKYKNSYSKNWEKCMVTAPHWRKDYGELQEYRKSLYMNFFRNQTLHHPKKVLKYGINLLAGRQETKTDLVLKKALGHIRKKAPF